MKISLRQAYSFILLGKRSNQEDSRFPDMDVLPPNQRFFIVCDGVGGHAKGEVASGLVANTIGSALMQFDWSKDFTNADFGRALDKAYNALDANAANNNHDMATTMVLAAFHGSGMTLAHIGDSRIYHIRPDDGIIYRSDDHSMVNTMVHNGMITPDEAETDKRRHIITRYMSPTDADQTRCMATVLQTADVKDGDYVFLCSDGVLQSIDDEMLIDIMGNATSDEQIIAQMKERCQASSDNSTAILIHVDHVEYADGAGALRHGNADGNTIRCDNNEAGVVNIASTLRTNPNKPKCGIWSFLKRIFGIK